MADTSRVSHVYAGVARSARDTIGGIFRRATGDERWTQLTNGLPDATDVQAITIHPENPDVIYAGTNTGPYRSTDRGEHWERLGVPDNGLGVWALTVHPTNPRILYAGTSPIAVFLLGETWQRFDHSVKAEATMMAVALHPR